ncbi:hypothetical protein FRC07_010282 [Ceratobasidium sp. 392]|nr:hypothetical protein FRC07_010282 [Ceratobasidium sp. 392]
MQHLVEHGCQDVTQEIEVNNICVPIAHGGSSDIYQLKLRDGTEVAVKCLRRLQDFNSSGENCKIFKRTARETYTWSKCDHPNILRIRGMALFQGQVAVVSPWMKNGTLSKFLRTHSSADRIQLCVQLAGALEYMHDSEVVHGDIKADNVVVSSDNIPLFTDFGNTFLAYEATLQFTATTSLGITPRYTAPEILKGDSRYSTEADIYAFGMMVLEIVTGQTPFAKKPLATVIYAVTVKKEIPDRPDLSALLDNKSLENELWRLLTCCWAYKPSGRPSATLLRKQVCEALDSGIYTTNAECLHQYGDGLAT